MPSRSKTAVVVCRDPVIVVLHDCIQSEAVTMALRVATVGQYDQKDGRALWFDDNVETVDHVNYIINRWKTACCDAVTE